MIDDTIKTIKFIKNVFQSNVLYVLISNNSSLFTFSTSFIPSLIELKSLLHLLKLVILFSKPLIFLLISIYFSSLKEVKFLISLVKFSSKTLSFSKTLR